MSRIKHFITWLRRVPLGVWIFFAFTQVVTLVFQSFKIEELQEAIDQMTGEPGFQGVRQDFIEFVADKKQTVIEAACLLVVFIGLGVMRAFSRDAAHFTLRDLPRFTLRDLFAVTFLIAMLAGTLMAIGHSQIPPLLAIPLFVFVLAIAVIGLVALLIGAVERKAQSDERRFNRSASPPSD
jgi:hypothetical protein